MQNKALKGFTIVVAGKGGTGKTLVSALLVREAVKRGSVLIIDADPDSNMPEILGVEVKHTVGHVREHLLQYKTRHTESTQKTPENIMQQGVMEAIAEEKGFDLLVMGRGEGEGCYCAVNHVLRSVIDTQTINYDTVIIDSEAGLEHISRRTARDVDLMLVVSDTSARGLSTADRVQELARELRVKFGRVVVCLNKVMEKTRGIIDERAKAMGLEIIGRLPFSETVAENDAMGVTIWDLPDDDPIMTAFKDAYAAIEDIRAEKENLSAMTI